MAKEEKRSNKKQASSSLIYSQRTFNATKSNKLPRGSPSNGSWGLAYNWNKHQLAISYKFNNCVRFIDHQELKIQRSVGAFGFKRDEFNFPSGLSYQPITNYLLVCDQRNHRLKIINEEDEVVAIIGTGGRRDVRFDEPTGVDCGPSGNFFVTDKMNYRVQIFEASGRFLGKFGRIGSGDEQLDHPYDLSVLDRRFAPSSVASSMVLVADCFNKRLSVWSADGSQHIRNIGINAYARNVCVDLNGFVCVSTAERGVQVLDPRGEFARLQTILPGNYSEDRNCILDGICVDEFNTLIVADSNTDAVHFFD